MRVKVQYVEKVHKDIRRMVGWYLNQSDLATMLEVALFYREFGTEGVKQAMDQWVAKGKPTRPEEQPTEKERVGG